MGIHCGGCERDGFFQLRVAPLLLNARVDKHATIKLPTLKDDAVVVFLFVLNCAVERQYTLDDRANGDGVTGDEIRMPAPEDLALQHTRALLVLTFVAR